MAFPSEANASCDSSVFAGGGSAGSDHAGDSQTLRRSLSFSCRSSSERVSVNVDGGVVCVVSQKDDLLDNLDANGDGIVDADEMRHALPWLSVRADILLVRLLTETGLVDMLRKLPPFLLAITLFLTGLLQFSPPASNHEVHQHVQLHFGLDAISGITNFNGIYSYMETFAQKNAEMQASSHEYWCEARYSKYVWDHVLSVPHWLCRSPRQYALTLNSDRQWSWSSVTRREGPSEDTTGKNSESQARNVSANGSLPCEDNDFDLQDELGNDTVSCVRYPGVCDMELGLTLCPRFCGFCSPWEYKHTRLYPSPQVAVLPALVYQTRLNPAPCQGFARVFEKQPYNTALWRVPPLDGYRHGRTIRCLDRANQFQEPFAMERDCPPRAPKSVCPLGGKFRVTKKATLAGKTVYPKLLTEPKRFVDQMRHLQWLDVQTESITLSTMVYTEEAELFTSLSVTFKVTRAGRVASSFRIVSYRDIIGESKTIFIVCQLCASLIALTGMLFTFNRWYQRGIPCRWGDQVFELISRALLAFFPLVLIISWSQHNLMAHEYDKLLNAFLGVDSSDEELWSKLAVEFFLVKDQIYSETEWVKYQRIAAFVVLYFQSVQFLMYLRAHPKMGILTSTMVRASSHLIHFLPLFTISYVSLGFLAHWMVGAHIPAFSTFGKTMVNQCLMILGESYLPEGVQELTPGFSVIYWLYSATFIVVVFFTLRNFLLAIIVDAFCEVVKDNAHTDAILGDFFSDLWWTIYINVRWRWKRWPERIRFVKFLEAQIAKDFQANDWIGELEGEQGFVEAKKSKKVIITPDIMIASIDGLDDKMLGDMLSFYYALSTKILVRRSQENMSITCSPVKMFSEPDDGPQHKDCNLDLSVIPSGRSSAERAASDQEPELPNPPVQMSALAWLNKPSVSSPIP